MLSKSLEGNDKIDSTVVVAESWVQALQSF